MFPTILLSNNQKTTETFLQQYMAEHNFSDMQIERITPLKSTITIDQIRQLKKELAISSAKPRLIIFESFENTNTEAQNALLKVLEEMNKVNQFILISSRLEKILPTIVSRCKIVDLEKSKSKIDQSTKDAIVNFLKTKQLSSLSDPSFQKTSKEDAVELLNDAIILMSELMKKDKPELASYIKKTFDLSHKLQSNNLSPQLTIDSWIIMMFKS